MLHNRTSQREELQQGSAVRLSPEDPGTDPIRHSFLDTAKLSDDEPNSAAIVSVPSLAPSAEQFDQDSGPDTESAIEIEATVQSLVRYIECRTFGRVHRLQVERHQDRLVLYGRTTTFYAKQLVQHAALEVANGTQIENRIEVMRSGLYAGCAH